MDDQQSQLREIHGSKGGGTRQDVGRESRDPRVSAVTALFMNVLQGLIAITLAFVANNIYQINLTLAADAVTKQDTARQLAEIRTKNDQQDDHISATDQRVYTLEGHNLRGGPARGN